MKFLETCGGKIINVQSIKAIFINENEDGLVSLIQTRDGHVCDYFNVPDCYERLDGKQAKVDRDTLQQIHRFSIGEICDEGEGLLDYDTLDHNSWARFGKFLEEEDSEEKSKQPPREVIEGLLDALDKLASKIKKRS